MPPYTLAGFDLAMQRRYQRGCQKAYLVPKIQIWENFRGLAMEDFGLFYGHLVYFTAILYILWPLGIFCGHLVYFMVI
jgi:hypothetical protein